MKSFTSWLLIAVLVGLLTKNVWSFPAHRAVDLSSDVLAEDTDAEDGDDDDTKSDDNKRVEIAKEGSGLDASKKTAVEQGKGESSAEESSGEEENDAKETADANKKDEMEEENTDDGSSEKRTDLPKPNPAVAKRNGCCDCCPEEECCHHCHEHEGCCHEGCCCGHENEHEHGHHEHEDCCHHHGHHHGFCHEWGHECCGEHHGHECCGHHEHGQHHENDHEHEHCHCHNCCEKHEEEEPECCCCCGGHRRSDVPVGYHCHDMVSKEGSEKTKRFCVPVYEETNSVRSNVPSVVKKQTVHVGYGYASGDNYRLGYQEGGMGGLASSFTGQVGADHGGNFDAADHFNKRSLYHLDGFRQKRHYDSGHGYGSFNSGMMHGSATPYGHPVTHPGFTTMGFPGHALASQDVRNMISHPKEQ